MTWPVEFTDEFGDWWSCLDEHQQDEIDVVVRLLEELGPQLPYPYSSDVRSSRHGHLRELRIQIAGSAVRVFYAFDPRRVAMLLAGGKKTGNDRFYEIYVPLADKLYDEHLAQLRKEGLLNGQAVQGVARTHTCTAP